MFFQVIPIEIEKISFIKPACKRVMEQASTESGTVPPKKKRVSGPQDAPKLPPTLLYKSLFKLVTNACLFTIIDEPKENNPVSDVLTDPVSDVPTDPVSDIPTVSDVPTDPVSDVSTDSVSDAPTVSDVPTDPVSDVPTDPISVEQTSEC